MKRKHKQLSWFGNLETTSLKKKKKKVVCFLSQLPLGERRDTPRTSCQLISGLTWRHRQAFTLTRPICPNDCLWTVGGSCGTHTDTETTPNFTKGIQTMLTASQPIPQVAETAGSMSGCTPAWRLPPPSVSCGSGWYREILLVAGKGRNVTQKEALNMSARSWYLPHQHTRWGLCKEAPGTTQLLTTGCKMLAGKGYMDRHKHRNICTELDPWSSYTDKYIKW